MATLDERFEAAATKAEDASEIGRQWANGDDTTVIPTESGNLPSLAKFLADNSTQISDNDTRISTLESQNLDTRLTDEELKSLRADTEAELKRNASFFMDATTDNGIVSSGLSKVASGVAAAITITNPDGITGIGADGKIYDSGVGNVPIVYDESGVCQGLQVAPSSTNLLLWSEDFTQSDWTKNGSSISLVGSVESPVDGGDSYKMTEDVSTGIHGISQSQGSYQVGDKISSFAVLREAGRSSCRLTITGSALVRVKFDLDSGAFSVVQGGVNTTAKIKRLFNGFYYCQVTTDAESAGAANVNLRMESSSGDVSYQGNGSDGVYIAASQLEQGYPTPYIKTEASQVTRGAVRWVTGGLSINTNKFTLFADLVLPDVFNEQDFSTLVQIADVSGNNRAGIEFDGGGRFYPAIFKSGSSIAPFQSVNYVGGRVKLALVIDGLDVKGYRNGSLMWQTTLNQDLEILLTDFATLSRNDTRVITGTCLECAVAQSAVSDADAIALTTLEQ